MTRLITISVLAGLLLGLCFQNSVDLAALDTIAAGALTVLCFSIGIELGRSRSALAQLRESGLRLLLLPAAVVVGSTLGSALVGLMLGLGPMLGAAVGSGFGWYSLSAIILTQLKGAELGTIAFITNLCRELMAILLAPSLARLLGAPAVIAAAGATAMDSVLPVITRVAGSRAAVPAFITGLILSALVPVLVPLLAGL